MRAAFVASANREARRPEVSLKKNYGTAERAARRSTSGARRSDGVGKGRMPKRRAAPFRQPDSRPYGEVGFELGATGAPAGSWPRPGLARSMSLGAEAPGAGGVVLVVSSFLQAVTPSRTKVVAMAVKNLAVRFDFMESLPSDARLRRRRIACAPALHDPFGCVC
jgi:hypothetical protein